MISDSNRNLLNPKFFGKKVEPTYKKSPGDPNFRRTNFSRLEKIVRKISLFLPAFNLKFDQAKFVT